LLVRLLDDIHALAEFSTSFARRFDETIDLMDRMDRQTAAMMPMMEKALPLMTEGNRNMAAALPVMERIIPAVTQATFFTAPLGGAIDRVGRVVERLPRRPVQGRATPLPSSSGEQSVPEAYESIDG
jgi:hypothetical protein